MNATIARTTLIAALSSASKVIESRPSTPILGMVLLSFTADNCTLSAQSACCHIGSTFDAVSSGAHAYCIDPAPLLAALTQAGGDTVAMDYDGDGRVKVACGAAKYRLNTMDATEYPAPVVAEHDATIVIGGASLASLLTKVLPSVATDDNRYGLNGVAMDQSAVGLRLISTDGNRLTYDEAPAAITGSIPHRRLIPASVVKMIAAVAAGTDGDVSIALADRSVRVTVPGAVVTGRLLEADFPDYRQVLPTDSGKGRAVFAVSDLMRAVKSAMPLAGGATRDVAFALAADTLTLSSSKLDTGSAEVTCPCEWGGEPIVVGLNATFVASVLSVATGGRVTAEIHGALAPTLWRDEGAAVFVIMPVRLT